MDGFMPIAYWVHDLEPVLFQLTDTLAIRWYGLSYLAGFLSAYFLLRDYFKRSYSPIKPQQLEGLMFTMIIGVILGGRMGYVFLYDLDHFLSNPLSLFEVWKGGMASHGGFVGVIVATILYAKRQQLPVLKLGDLIASIVPPGLFFGRLANFINGELWGKPSEVAWAVIFPQSAAPGTPIEWISPRHPSQLYEAALEGLVLFLYLQIRLRKSKVLQRPGMLTGEFLILYSVLRVIGELFREPDAALILGMSRGSFYSLLFIVVGLGFLFNGMRRAKL